MCKVVHGHADVHVYVRMYETSSLFCIYYAAVLVPSKKSSAKSNGRPARSPARVLNITDTDDAHMYSSIDYSYSQCEPTVSIIGSTCYYHVHSPTDKRKGLEVKAKPPPVPSSAKRGKLGNANHTPSEQEGLGNYSLLESSNSESTPSEHYYLLGPEYSDPDEKDRIYADPASEPATPGRDETGDTLYADPKVKGYNTVSM